MELVKCRTGGLIIQMYNDKMVFMRSQSVTVAVVLYDLTGSGNIFF